MTAFVDSFATQQLLPPWEAQGARIASFVIPLNEARIREYLGKYFNGAYPDQAPYPYAPFPGPQFGLLTVSNYPNVRSTNRNRGENPVSGGDVWDRISHVEAYLAIPAVRSRITEDQLLTEPTLVWTQPFVYSDNDTIVFSSREIWGSDMFLTTIVREEELGTQRLHVDVGMIGIKTFNPRSFDQLLACLHIDAPVKSGLQVADVLKAQPELQGLVDVLGGSGAFAEGLPTGVKPSPYSDGVELNNLKQFRDCYDMGAAIYRAIVASRTSYTRIDNLVFYDAAQTEIAFMWSDSQAELLRTILDAEGPTDRGPPPMHASDRPAPLDGMDWDMDRVVVRPILGFGFSTDVEFTVLSTLHTYGTLA
jgi:hypothetical protein